MKPQITFVTGNAFKADQVGWHLDMPLAHQKVDVDEIQSLDLAEVVRHKAMGAYKIIKTPVLVEDTSLTFESLGRLPGPLIKWFLEEPREQSPPRPEVSAVLGGIPSSFPTVM